MSCLPLPVLEGTRLYVDKTRQKTPKVVLPEPSLSTTDAGIAKTVCVPGLRGKHDVSGCAVALPKCSEAPYSSRFPSAAKLRFQDLRNFHTTLSTKLPKLLVS